MTQRPAGAATREPGVLRLALTVPEGVPIELELATRGERVAGFLIDLLLLVLVGVALLLVIGAATDGALEDQDGWLLAIVVLLLFFLRSGWFLTLEIRGRGRTPGKRMAGLCVVDAAGGPLRVQALVARNLMREVELWLPLTLLLAPEALLPGASGALQLLGGLWVLGLLFFPVFHPQGARLGDLVAGTRVVRAPKAVLLPELGLRKPDAPTRAFTSEQLSVYGIFELQMLEKALRIQDRAGDRRETLVQVSRLIRKKLSWDGDAQDRDAEPFLRDFYAALRRQLEERLRLGKRKKDKHDKRG